MKTIKISFKTEEVHTIEIEANSTEEVIQIAKSIDLQAWKYIGIVNDFYHSEQADQPSQFVEPWQENAKNTIELSWHIDDVLMRDDTLTAEQAQEVLKVVKNNHDATTGVNWETIDWAINTVKGG